MDPDSEDDDFLHVIQAARARTGGSEAKEEEANGEKEEGADGEDGEEAKEEEEEHVKGIYKLPSSKWIGQVNDKVHHGSVLRVVCVIGELRLLGEEAPGIEYRNTIKKRRGRRRRRRERGKERKREEKGKGGELKSPWASKFCHLNL